MELRLLEPDAADMQQVQAGCLDRFRPLVARHQSAMFRYARSRLGSRTLAEDAVQEAFLAAFRGRHTYDASRPFRAWLWTILANTCSRLAKKRAERATTAFAAPPEEWVDPGASALAALERQDERRQLAELLAQLPDEQADAIRMRFFGELSFDEIAAVLSCSAATIKSRVRYGLEKLAGWLKSSQESPR